MTAAINLRNLLRFTTSTLLGLMIDLGVAIALVEFIGVHVLVAMTLGLLCGAMFNYIANELWVFSNGSESVSARRGIAYLAIVGIVLLTRLISVMALEWIIRAPEFTWLAITLSVGLSFGVNYGLSTILFSAPYSRANRIKDHMQ